MFIATIAILAGCAIPITAIVTSHLRGQKKIQVQLLEKEIELEKARLLVFEKETEKLQLELEQSKQLLIDHVKQ